jgi:hypothetical protein
MITKDDRKHMIDTGEANGWKMSFGEEFDSLHFSQEKDLRFLDIYFNRAGMVINEAWSDLGPVQPDVQHVVDYLKRRGTNA